MSALDLTARGLAVQALAPWRTGPFAALAGAAIPPGVLHLHTSGHHTAGTGAALYAHDAACDAALLAVHPTCAFAAADGRIFRLLPQGGAISAEQCGARGDPALDHTWDDRPALQAALDYAAAMAIGEVRLEQRHYSIRAPQRTSPADASAALDGHPLVIAASLVLRSACGDSHLHFRAHDGSPMGAGGQPVKATAQSTGPDALWRGGGIRVRGAAPGTLVIEHVHLLGGREITPAEPEEDAYDPTDHGLWLDGAAQAQVTLIGVEIAGFRGDLYRTDPAGPLTQRLEHCHFHIAGGAALRHESAHGQLHAGHCRFGPAADAVAITAGAGHTFAHCLFADAARLSVAGMGAFTRLERCTAERIGQCRIGSWVEGDLTTIDAPLILGLAGEAGPRQIALTLTAWLAEADGADVVTLTGPASGAENDDAPTPAQIAVHVVSAQRWPGAAGNADWHAIFALGGRIDPATVRLSAGACTAMRYVRATALADAPFIAPAARFTPLPGGTAQGGDEHSAMPGAALTLEPVNPVQTITPNGAGTVALAFGQAHGHAEGQIVRLRHGGGTGEGEAILRLSPGDAGLALSGPIELRHAGDELALRYDAADGLWRPATSSGSEAGEIAPARIPALPASRIASGTIDPARLPPPEWDAITGKPPFGLLAGADLPVPDGARIPFWNTGANAVDWLALGGGLSLAGGALSATGGGGGGSAGWTLVDTVSPGGVSAIDLTAPAAGYSDLLLAIEGLSHDHTANTNLSIALSADGSTFAAPTALGTSAPSTASWHGAVQVPLFTGESGMILVSVGNILSAPGQAITNANAAWRVSGGIAAIRIAVGAGSFDAGTVRLFAR